MLKIKEIKVKSLGSPAKIFKENLGGLEKEIRL